jgi:hypothetical protein
MTAGTFAVGADYEPAVRGAQTGTVGPQRPCLLLGRSRRSNAKAIVKVRAHPAGLASFRGAID